MNEQEREEFGEYIKRLRLNKGFSLRQVEKAVGISNSYLYQIERGERNAPKLEVLRKLADTYGVTLSALLKAAHLSEPDDEVDYYPQDELERAFQYVRTDKRFHFGTQMNGNALTPEAKQFVVEVYQKLAGRILFPSGDDADGKEQSA